MGRSLPKDLGSPGARQDPRKPWTTGKPSQMPRTPLLRLRAPLALWKTPGDLRQLALPASEVVEAEAANPHRDALHEEAAPPPKRRSRDRPRCSAGYGPR